KRKGSMLLVPHPDSFRRRATDAAGLSAHSQRNRTVVVARLHGEKDAWPDAFALKKFEQFAVSLVEAVDLVLGSLARLAEQNQPPSPAFSRALQFQAIAVGATVFMTQLGHQLLLKSPGNRVFQPLCLFMHFIPLHAKDFGKHAFYEM